MIISPHDRTRLGAFTTALIADSGLAKTMAEGICLEFSAHSNYVGVRELYAAAVRRFKALPQHRRLATTPVTDGVIPYTVIPPAHRPAFILVDMLRLSYGQAASVCGCPLGSIKSRLFRARAVLAAHKQKRRQASG